MATDKYEPFYSNRLGMVTDKQIILVAYEYFRSPCPDGSMAGSRVGQIKLYVAFVSCVGRLIIGMLHLVDTTDHNVTLTD